MLEYFKDIIVLLIKSKIFFKLKKKNIIIYDCINSYELSKILDKKNYFILSSRKTTIKNIYLTKNIAIFLIKNFFKRGTKLNYMISVIKEINPKIVITNIDNSVEFSLLAKYFHKKIKFIAVQGANRNDIYDNTANLNQYLFIPNFLCYSIFDKTLFKNRKIKVEKFIISGSLKNSFYKNKYNKKNKKKYDICYISKKFLKNTFKHDSVKNLEYLAKYALKYKKKVIIQSKVKKNLNELKVYKRIFKGLKIVVEWRSSSKHSAYESIDKSSIVLGAPTTLLREAYYFNKKVLCCDSAKAANIKGYPFKGENYLKDFNYIDFEKRLNNLIKSSFKEYLFKLGKPKNFFMGDINTVALIKNLIKKELKHK